MKRTIPPAACTLLALAFSVPAQLNLSDLQRNGYQGPVVFSQETVCCWDKEAGKLVRTKCERFETEFNDRGMTSEDWRFDESGKLADRNAYSYDSLGRLVQKRDYDTRGTVERRENYAYTSTDSGTTVTYERFEEGRRGAGLYDRGSRRYDAAGELVEDVDYDDRGKLESTQAYRYTYDSQGRKVACAMLDERGGVAEARTFRYDDAGRLVEVVTRDARGNTTRREVSEYDSQGRLAKLIAYGRDGKVEKLWGNYLYDAAGSMVSVAEADPDGEQDVTTRTLRYAAVAPAAQPVAPVADSTLPRQ